MKSSTLFLYFILTGAAMLFTTGLYAGATISLDLLTSKLFFTHAILFISLLFVSLSYSARRVIVKKNLLRISLLLIAGLFIASFTTRILEFARDEPCFICLGATFIYLLLFITLLISSKQLYLLVKKVFN